MQTGRQKDFMQVMLLKRKVSAYVRTGVQELLDE